MPGAGDIAVFDGTSLNDSTIDAGFAGSVAGIQINTGYTGTITQASGVGLTVGSSGYSQTVGTFTGSNSGIDINGTFTLNGGTFNAPSGTLNFTSSVTVGAGGTFNPNGGTVAFSGNLNTIIVVPASFSLSNITVNKLGGNALFFNSTSTLVATGTVTLTDGFINNNVGTGTINGQGAVSIASTFDGGSAAIAFSGSADQTFVNNGGANPTGVFTINKPSGTVTLLSNLILGATQPLNITSGNLHQGASSSIVCGPVTVGTNGTWLNFGIGDITTSGGVVNNGTIKFNAGGSACGDADDISITSPAPGNAWSGSGTFALIDVTVSNQAGTAPITVFNGTDGGSNGVNWTFNPGCIGVPTASGGVVTGRIVDQNGNGVAGAVVRLQGTQNRKFITDANGVYRFQNVESSGFYTLTPSRVNYTFNPAARSFSQIGETTEAAFNASLLTSGFVNPLDTPEYFVRQHYLDFLGREPDEAGFNFWSDQIIECGAEQSCIDRRKENVSAAYFLSIEFQQTGGLVDGMYRASYGTSPQYASFMPDTRAVGLGVRVGEPGWEATLRANKEAFANAFVNRAAFHQMYDGMDNSLFVDTLIGHTGVTFTASERDALVSGLANGQTRGDVLRSIAENQTFANAKFNEAFVMMEYFGYLRRDADAGGYAYWLDKLNRFDGNFEQAEMVRAFIVSGEYRGRFQ